MITSLYYRERARRWADEVRGLPRMSLARGTAIRRIAEREFLTVVIVRKWVKLVEREEK